MNTKFENMILYICKKSADDARFGRTKLNKLMYFSDFGFYLKRGSSISGEEYMANTNGPVPRHMKPVLDGMLADGRLGEIAIPTGLRPQQKPIAKADPKESDFSKEELGYIDDVLSKYERMNGTELSALSHAEPGFKAAKFKETIPYGTAYFPPYASATQAVKEKTQRLASQYKWLGAND
ncbi:MAG: SocA family protein [Alphaproteobacteria bacterium]|nr:SocA family protein [Alphaproteobacteria bacterium]